MWIIKWCRKEEILHNFYAVLPESHKVDSKGLLVMFRPPVLFTTTMYYRTMPIENLKGWSLCTLPFNGPIKEILNDLQKKELPSLTFQKRRRSDHAKDIETGKILSIMSMKNILCVWKEGSRSNSSYHYAAPGCSSTSWKGLVNW